MSKRLTDFPQRVALILNRGSGLGIEVLGWCNGEPSDFHNYTHNSILKTKDDEIKRLQNWTDLMVDEFKRIGALSTSDDELKGLCARAIANTKQNVSVVDQRDTFERENTKLKSRIATLEKQLERKEYDC